MNYNYFNPSLHMPKKGYMKVTGVGTVKAIPDTALVNLGIITENVSLERARRENAIKSTAVVNMLNSMGINNNQISTGSFTIEPLYDFVEGRQIFKGFRVSNILSVTVTEIANIGEVIDRATTTGVNRVDNIAFTMADPADYYDKALNLAIENALHKGSEIGNALDVEIDEVPYRIIEKSVGAPTYDTSVAKLSAPATPVLPGQIEITSVILVILGYK